MVSNGLVRREALFVPGFGLSWRVSGCSVQAPPRVLAFSAQVRQGLCWGMETVAAV